MAEFRTENDSLGPVDVPADALYGAQTQRAKENFRISSLRFPRLFIRSMGIVKRAAALANLKLGLLDGLIANAIVAAAERVEAGDVDDAFVLDIFQTGSGTSTNMNANEVIGNLASLELGGHLGDKSVHPNDHVNMSQSSNDVIPTVMHVSAKIGIEEHLKPALENLLASLNEKSLEFDHVLKSGRTHLMDATPVRLGQEFLGYAYQIRKGLARLDRASTELSALALGGTAVGTGINRHVDFPRLAIANISDATGLPFREAENHFEAQSAKDAYVYASGVLNSIAAALLKIANDIR
ncbi:MAG: aspartate ammonia-lyase, partial [Rhodothermales bacterium]|nr:aspartate ammonia-lyase [Rhodothermales bacterium]